MQILTSPLTVRTLSPELEAMRKKIEGWAREYGLDFYETIFEVLDYSEMNMVAAYGGFPNRYPHWKFGMEFERLTKSYAYGLHKIYEMVINNDPCYAYLLECNHDVDQKLVMAHVHGHCDFFKNNIWFSKTNRKMMDTMANHATKVRKTIDRHGLEAVESFLDRCLSLEDLIDRHSMFIQRQRKDPENEPQNPNGSKISSSEYMDGYINPPEILAREKLRLEQERRRRKHFPEEPQRDILLFLLENAPLEDWQQDILSMIRDEAYYFAPQAQTKIMNEGWATYWHAKIMTEKALTDTEVIDFADHHSGTVAMHPGQLNPYKLGFELWKDIEDRWNKGKFRKRIRPVRRLDDQTQLGQERRTRQAEALRDAACSHTTSLLSTPSSTRSSVTSISSSSMPITRIAAATRLPTGIGEA
jgi:stage V sporulation protein R